MEEELFVDKHHLALVQRVKNIEPILDGLLSYKVINREHYEEILSLHGPRGKMRALLSGPLRVCGPGGKEIFYKLLREHESDLLDDLADESEKYEKNKKDMEKMKKMNRTDLVQRLSDVSSGTKVEPLPSLIQSVETTAQHRLLEMTTEAFEKMNRTDLVQRLSQSSSGPKKKHSEAQRPAVIQKRCTLWMNIDLHSPREHKLQQRKRSF
ncbi:hypothetical protein CgunFtcFv8_021687 [Champsocephalus gunnari]|uniref:CARD domain-containing protein n=1 Tax=Champsocephalus gunnari TaxID=52237 RepID=A0AAN8HRK4_CHAGU|nr:hypothetical protein CgunFtcFv8_021687 [Champsocephalus gunnari]